MILTPDGKPAGKIDRIMLLAMWARHLQQESQLSARSDRPPIIVAGLGKPSFPLSLYAANAAVQYWSDASSRSQDARHLLRRNSLSCQPSVSGIEIEKGRELHQEIAAIGAVINYGDPKGDLTARTKMAKALSAWYKSPINSENILFTVGGAFALHIIFETLKKKHPRTKIITPFPYYSLYRGVNSENILFPIPVMQEKGYQLTAKILAMSLKRAEAQSQYDYRPVSAFLFCDPNNPLGTIVEETELQKIAEVLRQYPHILIILDEAYAEMRLDGAQHVSLLTIAPDLKKRSILMRSATKALSLAGERMAILAAFDEDLMAMLLQENLNRCGHAPRAGQHAFAEAMAKLDGTELRDLNQYYSPQIGYVAQSLRSMEAAMPDPDYKVRGTFYVLADLSELLGLDLPPETYKALNKTGIIQTDEDIAYYLLFIMGLMIAPLSYFGLDNRKGYMRITCGGGLHEMQALIQRLENCLIEARKVHQAKIKTKLDKILLSLFQSQSYLYPELLHKKSNIEQLQYSPDLSSSAAAMPLYPKSMSSIAAILKQQNLEFEKILLAAENELISLMPAKNIKAVITIQSFWKMRNAQKEFAQRKLDIELHWKIFVENFAANDLILRDYLLSYPSIRRLTFLPFKKHLSDTYSELSSVDSRNTSPLNSSFSSPCLQPMSCDMFTPLHLPMKSPETPSFSSSPTPHGCTYFSLSDPALTPAIESSLTMIPENE